MGLLNVYQMRAMRPHINYRFKCNIWSYEGNFIPTNNYFEYTVKKVKLPTFKLETENKISFGNTAYVIPIINFAETSLDITFEEDENMSVFEMLSNFFGNNAFDSAKMKLICVKVDQFDETMMNHVDSKLYLCRLKEFSQPNFNNNGRGAPVEITASFNVVYIYQGDAKDSGFDYDSGNNQITRPEDEDVEYLKAEMRKDSLVAEEIYKKKEQEQKEKILKSVQGEYGKYKDKAFNKLKSETLTNETKKRDLTATGLTNITSNIFKTIEHYQGDDAERNKEREILLKAKQGAAGKNMAKDSFKFLANDLEVDISDGIDSSEKNSLMSFYSRYITDPEELQKVSTIIDIYSDAQINVNILTDSETGNTKNALKTVIENNGGDYNDLLLRTQMELSHDDDQKARNGSNAKVQYSGKDKKKTHDFYEEEFETDKVMEKLALVHGDTSPIVDRDKVLKVRTENKKSMQKAYGKLQDILDEKGLSVQINAYDDANHAASTTALESIGSHLMSSKIDLAIYKDGKRVDRYEINEYLDTINAAAKKAGFTVNWEGYAGKDNIWGDWALTEALTIDSKGNIKKVKTSSWTPDDQIAIVNSNGKTTKTNLRKMKR